MQNKINKYHWDGGNGNGEGQEGNNHNNNQGGGNNGGNGNKGAWGWWDVLAALLIGVGALMVTVKETVALGGVLIGIGIVILGLEMVGFIGRRP